MATSPRFEILEMFKSGQLSTAEALASLERAFSGTAQQGLPLVECPTCLRLFEPGVHCELEKCSLRGLEVRYSGAFDQASLDLIDRIESLPWNWPAERRKARAQVLIINALRKAALQGRRA